MFLKPPSLAHHTKIFYNGKIYYLTSDFFKPLFYWLCPIHENWAQTILWDHFIITPTPRGVNTYIYIRQCSLIGKIMNSKFIVIGSNPIIVIFIFVANNFSDKIIWDYLPLYIMLFICINFLGLERIELSLAYWKHAVLTFRRKTLSFYFLWG